MDINISFVSAFTSCLPVGSDNTQLNISGETALRTNQRRVARLILGARSKISPTHRAAHWHFQYITVHTNTHTMVNIISRMRKLRSVSSLTLSLGIVVTRLLTILTEGTVPLPAVHPRPIPSQQRRIGQLNRNRADAE